MFVQQPQYMYPGGQGGGMVLIQPSGAVTTVPQGYQVAGQQAVFVPTSQVTQCSDINFTYITAT